MREKKWNRIGILTGVAAIVIGVIFILTPVDFSQSVYYCDSAEFGADFYTYLYESTSKTAGNLYSIFYALEEMSEKAARYVGTGFVIGGVLTVVKYKRKQALLLDSEERTGSEAVTAAMPDAEASNE